MWLTTLDGMYSIVDKAVEGPDHLCVRSRDEDSLVRMRGRIIDFAKGDDESVYVKTGPNDGVMCQGKFWTGERVEDECPPRTNKHLDEVDTGGGHVQQLQRRVLQ